MKVGVVALQGAFREHREVLDALGATALEVRAPENLGGVDAVVLPGGESTTIRRLLVTSGLEPVLRETIQAGTPLLATCAGLILVSKGGPLASVDCSVARNAYGPQVASFEAPLTVNGLPGGTFQGVFIRAPVVERVGAGVEVLATHGDHPVYIRSGSVRATTFHPELADDPRLHEQFLSEVTA